VSRAVARLEESLGTRLVQRNSRSVTVTSEGRAFYGEVSPAVTTIRHAARGVDAGDEGPRGRLRVSAPNDIGTTVVAGLVAEFTALWPNVAVDVELSTRHVQLVEDGFDVAIRAAAKLADSSLVVRKVGDLEAELYASPAYVALRGAPSSPAELSEHACVLHRPVAGRAEWILDGPDGRARSVVSGRVSGDDFTFLRAAVLANAGIALLPRTIAAPDVAAGHLVRVLPAYTARGQSLFVLYASAPKVSVKIAAFRDFLVDAFARK
jgi:DNA-binding transcriptional LysR family regulator